MTRLLRIYRARYHARRALTLTIRAVEHGLECDRLLAQPTPRRILFQSRTISNFQNCAAGTILLGALIGMVICTVWIAITWRAAG